MIDKEYLETNYDKVDKTFSLVKANIIGALLVIPFLFLGPMIYYSLVSEVSQINSVFIFLCFIVGIPIHEFIHGFTWHLFCKNKWKSIKF